MDKCFPYGKSHKGNALLYPHPAPPTIAWRDNMKKEEDWGALRRSGLGRKLNPTLFIALLIFLPNMLLSPLLFIIYHDSTELALQRFLKESIIGLAYIIIAAFLTIIIGYALNKMDDLVKPYGKNKDSIQILFIDKLEYWKFGEKIYRAIGKKIWFILGGIGFLIINLIALFPVFNYDIYLNQLEAPIPHWTVIFPWLTMFGISLIVLIIILFLGAIIYGMFKVTSLGKNRNNVTGLEKNRNNLTITKFLKMMKSLNKILDKVQKSLEISKKKSSNESPTALVDFKDELFVGGRTFYEFQRGNRKIGEFLFNLATFLIIICVTFGILLWLVVQLKIFPSSMDDAIMTFTIALTTIGILSLCLFLFPQIGVHTFLKRTKYELIDQFIMMASRLEFIYFHALIDPSILSKVDNTWHSRKELLEEVNLVKGIVAEVKKYGTWSYDFPEILKLVVVAGSTIIPVILSFIGI